MPVEQAFALIRDGRLAINGEGKTNKFLKRVEHITFSGEIMGLKNRFYGKGMKRIKRDKKRHREQYLSG